MLMPQAILPFATAGNSLNSGKQMGQLQHRWIIDNTLPDPLRDVLTGMCIVILSSSITLGGFALRKLWEFSIVVLSVFEAA